MDARYLALAIAVLIAGGAWQTLRQSHSAFVWAVPFAVILLFLAFLGDPPSARVLHWRSDPPID
jgi:hypothetical protein